MEFIKRSIIKRVGGYTLLSFRSQCSTCYFFRLFEPAITKLLPMLLTLSLVTIYISDIYDLGLVSVIFVNMVCSRLRSIGFKKGWEKTSVIREKEKESVTKTSTGTCSSLRLPMLRLGRHHSCALKCQEILRGLR